MWSSWLSHSTLPALEQSVAFAQRRHTLLAGNIANLDVPGYRTRDLSVTDFQDSLRESIAASQSPQSTSPGHQPTQSATEKLRDIQHQVLYHDGSDISLEQQVTQISKNQSMHDTAIALMRSQFQTIQAAISESVAI